MCLIFPGLLGSAAFSGNLHAFSLWTAAGINCALYWILTLGAISVIGVLRRMVHLRK
jgi:hypothetical protein